MFTLYPIAFRVGIKIYRVGLLFTSEHDNFGMIFISDNYCDATVLKVIRYVSDRFSRRFDCYCEHLNGMIFMSMFVFHV